MSYLLVGAGTHSLVFLGIVMAKGAKRAVDLERIKKLVIIGMFSDDVLMDELVVKGGNAIDIILRVGSRASVDVDFSMSGDLPGGVEEAKKRIRKALSDTFAVEGLVVFDLNLMARPSSISADVVDFWGGYLVDFKLIEVDKTHTHTDIDAQRKNAIKLGQGTKFSIDISRFEFTEGKQAADIDGFRVYCYSPTMIACEKLRAICQQMPEYSAVVHRDRPGTARARDFLDIYTMVDHFQINLCDRESMVLLRAIFAAKKVPLVLLRGVAATREFHRLDWLSVVDTVRSGTSVEGFDFYFDFVVKIVDGLDSLGDE